MSSEKSFPSPAKKTPELKVCVLNVANVTAQFFNQASFCSSDVNECHDESLCTNGHCVNTEGSFFCNCNQPWIPDANKKKCVLATITGERDEVSRWEMSSGLNLCCSPDVNECEDPANCKNGHCVDTPGSYYCICAPPWTLAMDRNSCVTPEEQAGGCKPSCRAEL